MTEPLISIIVPVYRVESYLSRCVDSLLAQTYQNLEIILVDDGSPDQCPQICEDYAKKEERIHVIHQENRGLSGARNAGIDVAKGEYLAFVDSDDYIEPDMYEVLYKNCERYAADLATARFVKFNTQGEDRKNFTENIEVFSREEMLRLFIVGDRRYEITMSVWDRLYKRELISDLRFPVGKCYEDIVFSTKVIEKSKINVYIDRALYHYRLREDSISGEDFNDYNRAPLRIITDLIPELERRILFLDEKGEKELADECRYQYIDNMFKYLTLFKWDSNTDEILKNKISNYCEQVKLDWKKGVKFCLKLLLLKHSVTKTVKIYFSWQTIKKRICL